MGTLEAEQFNRGLRLLETGGGLGGHRRRLLAQARGRVLEIGAGTGANVPLYPPAARVVATEPNEERLAALPAASAGVQRAGARAEALPFAAATFDTVVGTLVFCSIADPLRALAEIRRVLVPGGRLLLLEHVRGRTPVSRRLTDWLHPLWFALQRECHLNRDTAQAVARAGFAVERDVVVGWFGLLVEVWARAPEGV